MTNRILGGIAWACVILVTQSAWGQYSPTYPSASTSPASAQGVFQPGLSSEEYLRLMAAANEARLVSSPAHPSAVQLAANSAENKNALDQPAASPPSNAVSQASTSVQSSVQKLDPLSPPGFVHPAEHASVSGPQGIASPSARGRSPSVSFAMDPIWLRRGGDEGTSWSNGGSLGGFGEDQSAIYRIGWYSNPMERYEFAFLGSAVWNRYAQHPGPVDGLLVVSPLQPGWFEPFDDSTRHEQSHTAKLRSYEVNRRWITDDLANYFLGLHMIDYRESYRLQSIDPDGAGRLGLSTDNLLVGVQGGLELWHPISQRLALGAQGIGGLYGNFAEGSWRVDVESDGGFAKDDPRFQVAAGFGWDAKARYKITSRLQVFGSYRWWYLAGMATVDDQTIGPLGSETPFALSTDAGFLLQGATCGLEIVF